VNQYREDFFGYIGQPQGKNPTPIREEILFEPGKKSHSQTGKNPNKNGKKIPFEHGKKSHSNTGRNSI
jgi:hypothetical protein